MTHEITPPGQANVDGLVQNCNISIANALDIRQSCTKPAI